MTPKDARLLLTDREWQVARLACRGKKAREIAAEIGISLSTAKVHLAAVSRKLGKNFRYLNLFCQGESLSNSRLNNGNWKPVIISRNDKKCGRELLEHDIKTRKTSMAFRRFAKGDVSLTGEVRLAYAISGLGDREYLLKKRGEVLKTISSSTRYNLVVLTKPMLSSAVKKIIDHYNLRAVKTDHEDGSTTYTYLCRSSDEFNAVQGTIIGLPTITYDKKGQKIVIEYEKPVFVTGIRIKQLLAGKYDDLMYAEYNISSKIYEISLELQLNKSYAIELLIGSGAKVCYNFML